MIELFDKKYVYFLWSNQLDSTACFVSNSIESLINLVNSGDINKRVYLDHIRSTNRNKPFRTYDENGKPKDYVFAYYDPNYEFKIAYNQGKQIQETIDFGDGINRQWIDVEYPNWNISDRRHRIKPMNFIEDKI